MLGSFGPNRSASDSDDKPSPNLGAADSKHPLVLTPEQSVAVTARGNVLLMAGAGTGKTSTLVARVLSHLLDPARPVALDRILMVTFTEAAAAEMRHRVRARLETELAGAGDGAWLAEQLVRLDSAPIGTLHGFCLRLLREHFHELGLDPQLRVLDTSESRQVFGEVLDRVLDPLLGGTGEASAALGAWVSGMMGGDLEATRAFVARVHDFLRTRHDSEAWLRRQIAYWDGQGGSGWLTELQQEIPGWAEAWRRDLVSVVGSNVRAAACDTGLERVQIGVSQPELGWRGAVAAALRSILEVGVKPSGKGAAKDSRPALPPHCVRLMEDAQFLLSLLEVPEGGRDPLAEDWEAVLGHMGTLMRLVESVAAEFAAAKREIGALDFADLEQFALRLLGNGDTLVARAARERFEHVLVDEAQDLNPAQSAIIEALSRSGPGANRFLVGDVKQSIYRFRLADPGIFQAIARRWSEGVETGSETGGHVLPLTSNFRSHEGILAFVNALFPSWMRRSVGGVEYDAMARLHFGNREGRSHFAMDGAPRVEVHLRLTGVEEAENEPSSTAGGGDELMEETSEVEASMVAARLQELRREGFQVWDNILKVSRPMRWGDVVVLLRSPGTRGAMFARKFAEAGIPMATPPGSLHSQPEVRDLLNTLRILDNPLQDIPLGAVLRSGLGGIPDVNDLAVIRLAAVGEAYWTALNRFLELGRGAGLGGAQGVSETGGATVGEPGEPDRSDASEIVFETLESDSPGGRDPGLFEREETAERARRLWPRVNAFLALYAGWRKRAQRGSMAELIEALLDDTGYEAGLGEGAESAQRHANVRTLLELARRFDASQRGGLLRFLAFLQGHDETDLEAPVVAGADAVRLMSIHASKGLEFPVTVVAGLGTQFNLKDLTAPVILGRSGEVCPLVVMPSGDRYPSWPMWRAAYGLRCEMIGEELRLLYVAFTRACDRLILVGSASATSVEKWAGQSLPLPDAWMVSARCPLQWLLPTLGAECSERMSQPGQSGRAPLFDWRTQGEASVASVGLKAHPVNGLGATARGSAGTSEADAAWRYRHEAATHEAAKQSVTALRKRAVEAEDESAKRFRGAEGSFRILRDSGGNSVVEFNAAERGTIHHRFLEYVDLRQTGTRAGLESELTRMTNEGRFDVAEASVVDLDAMERLWSSDLGLELREAHAEVRREIPFTMRLTPGDLDELGLPHAAGLDAEEYIVVQGVIDIAVWRADGACWIGDFKTDRVDEEGLQAKARGYAPQLALYALALKRIHGRVATRRWLYFLSLGRSCDV